MPHPIDSTRFWPRAYIFRWPCLVIYLGLLAALTTLSFKYGPEANLLETESVFDYLDSGVLDGFDDDPYYGWSMLDNLEKIVLSHAILIIVTGLSCLRHHPTGPRLAVVVSIVAWMLAHTTLSAIYSLAAASDRLLFGKPDENLSFASARLGRFEQLSLNYCVVITAFAGLAWVYYLFKCSQHLDRFRTISKLTCAVSLASMVTLVLSFVHFFTLLWIDHDSFISALYGTDIGLAAYNLLWCFGLFTVLLFLWGRYQREDVKRVGRNTVTGS